jgi:hypothetical protein
MNKKTKMWVGVAVVAVAAYYFWNKKKQSDSAAAAVAPKAFANMTEGVQGPVTK